ncbi:Major sperm protein [Aphelenchoides besseyi]|nr:Major sperm protein [Aphelenchoides besseyi]
MAALAVDPPACQVPASGGTSTHQLNNTGASRLAFKVKSSNNNEYRLKPVFGFVEPGASAPLEITRLVSSLVAVLLTVFRFRTVLQKEDKMVIQFAEVAADATDAQAPFKAGPAAGEVVLPVTAQ